MKGRTYRYMSDPLFPYGFGLSYTDFAVGRASWNKTQLRTDESLTLTVPVSNTGTRSGTEVVQVYIRKTDDADGPLKSLRASARVELAAGANQDVKIELPSDSFECLDPSTNTMRVAPGEYELFYGTSSAARDLQSVKVTLRDRKEQK